MTMGGHLLHSVVLQEAVLGGLETEVHLALGTPGQGPELPALHTATHSTLGRLSMQSSCTASAV